LPQEGEPGFRLVETPEYREELDGLDVDGFLREALRRSAYLVLERAPHEGSLTRAGLRLLRRRILMPLLLVDVFYRIDEEAREVSLVSVRLVDTTRL